MKVISECDDWYSNRMIEGFHQRKTVQGQMYELSRMNMAKRCCSDDANLCEIISVAPEKDGISKEFIEKFLRKNKFDVKYREQLEKTSAVGTAAAYIFLRKALYLSNGKVKGGEVRINYVDADSYIPLSVENGEVTEAAFSGTEKIKGKKYTMLVIFTKGDDNRYKADTVRFDDTGKQIAFGQTLQLGDVKPFAVMRNAEVNNLDDMEGYGLPKLLNAIPVLKVFDLCFNVLFSDLDKAEKIVLINEALCTVRDKNGEVVMTPEQKRIFLMLGERLPEEKSLYQEYNPEIRIEQITKVFELVLSLISMMFGYGTKKYTFENGQIKTATECIGERQDSMQELNRQRKQAVQYIEDIVRAAMWFENQFNDTSYDLDEELSVQFDDSYIEDRVSKLEAMRADAISFSDVPILKKWYLMEKYNVSEEDAIKYIDEGVVEEEEPED